MLAHSPWIGIQSLCLIAASIVVGLPAQAQTYPSKPVKIISQSPAGNGPDVIGRIVADRLTQAWGQQVLVINRPGAGGVLAAQAAVASERDGYTLYQGNASSMLVMPLTQKLSFDLGRALAPTGLMGQEPFLIAVTPSLGVNTLSELIALAKKRPGEIMYAASGRGSMPNLVGELFRSKAGIDLTYVPYPSTAQALHDIMGGRISVIVNPLSSLSGAIEGGTVKVLATTSAQRLPNLPDLPTVAELIPGFAGSGWFTLMTPTGTSDEIVQKVGRDLRAVLSQPTLRSRFERLGIYVRPMTPAETATFIRSEQELWTPVVRQLGLASH
jgi:tripartite-type tricarboxylate transporter receptor subunit TctC